MSDKNGVAIEQLRRREAELKLASERVDEALAEALLEDAWQEIDRLSNIGLQLLQQLKGLRRRIAQLGMSADGWQAA